MNGLVAVICLAAAAFVQTAGEPASLSIRTEPGARVVWEGRPVGEAASDGSFSLSGMPYGRYRLELSRDGFEARRVTVEAKSGAQHLDLPLRAVSPAVAPARDSSPQPAEPDRPAAVPEPAGAVAREAAEVRTAPPEVEPSEEPAAEDEAVIEPEQAPAPREAAPEAADRPAGPEASSSPGPEGPTGAWVEAVGRWWWTPFAVLLLAWLAWRLAGRTAPAPPDRLERTEDPDSLRAFRRTLSPPGKSPSGSGETEP